MLRIHRQCHCIRFFSKILPFGFVFRGDNNDLVGGDARDRGLILPRWPAYKSGDRAQDSLYLRIHRAASSGDPERVWIGEKTHFRAGAEIGKRPAGGADRIPVTRDEDGWICDPYHGGSQHRTTACRGVCDNHAQSHLRVPGDSADREARVDQLEYG